MIRELFAALRCLYLRPRVAALERDIAEHQQACDAWPLTRAVWQCEVARLRREIDRVCGSKHGSAYAVRSLMPKDKR